MQAVGVIGAGQMGAGIAQVSAAAGYRVLLSDVDKARAETGKAGIAKRLARDVEKGKIEGEARDRLLDRIEPVDGVAGMSSCGLVIEAATEREEIKRAIFKAVGEVLGHQAVLASNTSSIPITRLAQSSPDPKRFIGLHFFNPVPVMGLIEVIPGLATSADTVARTRAFAELLGKQIVQAEDDPFMSPGCIPAASALAPQVTLEVSASGGHVGFVGGTLKKPHMWLEHRIPAWLSPYLDIPT